jgi:hypothetical protein
MHSARARMSRIRLRSAIQILDHPTELPLLHLLRTCGRLVRAERNQDLHRIHVPICADTMALPATLTKRQKEPFASFNKRTVEVTRKVASGGWPALPGGTGYPPSPNERFQVIPSSFPRLRLAHPIQSIEVGHFRRNQPAGADKEEGPGFL